MKLKTLIISLVAAAGIASVISASAAEALANKGYSSKNHPAIRNTNSVQQYNSILLARVYNWTNGTITAFINVPGVDVWEIIPSNQYAPFTYEYPNPPSNTSFGIARANFPTQYANVCLGGTINVYGNYNDDQLDIRPSC